MLTSFWHYIRKIFLGFIAAPDSNHNIIADEKAVYILGCSPTAGGDILKTDVGSDFPNIYPGTMPADGSWGNFTDNQNVSYTIHPLIATGLTIEKVWDSYQSRNPDPEPGGFSKLPIDQVGPLMRSSVYVYDLGDFDQEGIPDHNYDGDTKFFTSNPPTPT